MDKIEIRTVFEPGNLNACYFVSGRKDELLKEMAGDNFLDEHCEFLLVWNGDSWALTTGYGFPSYPCYVKLAWPGPDISMQRAPRKEQS